MMYQPQMQDTNPSCLQLIAQPATFTSQNVPPFQPMPDIPPNLQQFIPSVAVLVGNALARMSTINAAYTYLANNVIQSRYNSPLWMQTVSFAVMMLWIKTMQNQGVSIENNLEAAAGDAVVLKASYLASQNGVVFNHLDAGTQNEVRQLAMNHEQLRGQFDGIVQQYRQQVQLAQNPQAMAAAVGGLAGQAMALGNPSPTTNLYGSPVSKVRAPGDIQPYNGGATSSMPSMLKVLQPRQKAVKNDPFASFDAPAEPVQQPAPISLGRVTEMIDNTMHTRELTPVVEVPASQWRPVVHQLYKPAFAADQFKLCYEVTKVGNNQDVVVATVQVMEDNEMNEAEHRIPTLNRAMRAAIASKQNRPAGDAVVEDLELLVMGLSAQRAKETPEQTDRLAAIGLDSDQNINALGAVPCMDKLIVDALEQRLREGTGQNVYIASGTLVETIVTESTDMDVIMQSLRSCRTLIDIANALNDGVDKFKQDAPTLAAISQIGKYMTDEINFVLTRRMGLDLQITDMMQDMQDLMECLKNDHGRIYLEAFNAFQPKLVQILLSPACIGMLSIEVPADTPAVEGKDGVTEVETVGYRLSFDRDVGVVLLNMDSSEFGITINGNDAYEVFETNFPGFQPFIGAIVAALPDCLRIVVATLDGKRYGVHRSILGDKPTIVFNA